MMRDRPTLRLREWSKIKPDLHGPGELLRGLSLTDEDRALLNELRGRATLKVTELRSGLKVEVDQHIGTITLSKVRIVVMPKLRLHNLMRMVAYAFELSDLILTERETDYAIAEEGFVDLLGLSLLSSVERLARGGILPAYRETIDDLATPRGRLDMRHIATHPPSGRLRCRFDDLTFDHRLNQTLAAGLRHAAHLMHNADLRLDLARAADRLFGDLRRISIGVDSIRAVLDGLDRRSSHYRTPLTLIALLVQGSHLGDHDSVGDVPLSSFMLDMNRLFERFLERYLRQVAPDGYHIDTQESRSDVFRYLANPYRRRTPQIRPDLVFRKHRKVVAIADAKYKNRHDHPPKTQELYQLTAYGLAYPMPNPRTVLMLHPIESTTREARSELLFDPGGASDQVQILLCGVPVDRILECRDMRWWPLEDSLFDRSS